MTDNSQISIMEGGTMFTGPDSIALYRAVALRGALKLYAQTGMLVTRGMTVTKLLKQASEYTGKAYGRGNVTKAQAAAADMTVWIETMRSAIPVVDLRKH